MASLLGDKVTVSIDSIQTHPENPRKGDVVAISESLDALQQVMPLVVQLSTRFILGGNHCVDDQTEALTQRGWVGGRDIQEGDTILSVDSNRNLVWGPVRSVFRNEHYVGEMHHLRNRKIDSLVSPGHRFMLSDCTLKRVEDLRTKDKIVIMGEPVRSPGGPFSDAFVELVGWATTEGSYRKPKGNQDYVKPYVRISQLPGPYADRIQRCLESVGAEFTIGRGGRQGRVLSFNIRNSIAELLYDLAPNRIMTMDFIISLSEHQRRLLIETMVDADGHRSGRGLRTRQFTQLSPESMDRFVALCAISGHSTHVATRTPPKTTGEYRNSKPYLVATVRDKQKTVSLEKAKIKRDVVQYEGLIWCPETDYGTFVCRRGGKVHLTGNTYQAAVLLGWQEIDVMFIDVDDEKAMRILLALNRTADLGGYDEMVLLSILADMRETDEELLIGTGYSTEDVDELLADALSFMPEEDEADEASVAFAASVLDRLMPPSVEDEIEAEAAATSDLVSEEEKKGRVRRPAYAPPSEFVIFRFGELRAKVAKASYEEFVKLWIKAHEGDLTKAGIAAAVFLGVPEEQVEAALAEGTERWL